MPKDKKKHRNLSFPPKQKQDKRERMGNKHNIKAPSR
jgi:hypothetical protein